MKKYLLLPHIKIQRANALSSSYTVGFPAMTAWMGAVHFLERKIRAVNGLENIRFPCMGVSCFRYRLHVFKEQKNMPSSIVGMAYPDPKTGESTSFIEMPVIDLEVSILIECQGISGDNEEVFKERVTACLHSMKIAGGDIWDFGTPCIYYLLDEDDRIRRKLIRKLMPGYVLVERRDVLIERMKTEQSSLEALMDVLAVHCGSSCGNSMESEKQKPKKRTLEKFVPVAVGFHGITQLGHVKGQRDPSSDHCFAESVVTLGEFIMPYQLDYIDDMMWHYAYKADMQMYVCQNQNISEDYHG